MNHSIPFRDTTGEWFEKMTPTWLEQVLVQDGGSLFRQDSSDLRNIEQPEFILSSSFFSRIPNCREFRENYFHDC